MWIRSAFWEGKLRVGQEQNFKKTLEDEISPAMRTLPGVKDTKVLWPRTYEERSSDIICQMLVFFDEESDIAKMIASPARNAARQKVAELNSRCFEGRVSHINYECAP
jgi:antibiotic biosynthesis monooxygenase (ABM) superfamily enzyme